MKFWKKFDKIKKKIDRIKKKTIKTLKNLQYEKIDPIFK